MLAQLDEAVESWQEHTAEAPEGVGQLQVRVVRRGRRDVGWGRVYSGCERRSLELMS